MWAHEVKWDGYRGQAHLKDGKIQFFTRAGNDWSQQFITASQAVARLRASSAILDGEIVALRGGLSDFHELRHQLGEALPDIVYEYFSLWRSGSNAAAAASDSVCPSPRGLGAQGPADGSDPRQPERQSGTKRGAPIDPQGYDAGKKVTGRKRHILVDTLGLLLNVVVHRASVQDRDGTRRLLRDAAHRFPSITKIFADAGYQGPKTSSSSCPSAGSWSVPSLDQREEKMTNYPY